ncbi:TlpA family protein disulfide reductase [Methylomonas sp. LL1]|uniref:peroxiredoxin family protein n=1 Tax=Methylomonas sp. LL1 TaxID=2785785 RepID=UPI0018C3819D|nr:TlpA disulfide reductase family protein [Methylomonas sp. LL1]QPK63689.1 TlpA family protein disulfide reductase [Methylomonas sp. LL1]
MILLILIVLTGCHKRSGLQIDDPVPVVSLQDFHGRSLTLPQDLQGKTMLIRFWSLECGFCDKEVLLGLEQLYQKYKGRGFVPVAVNVSKIDPNDERLQRFEHLTYPMLVDERGLVAKKFGVIGLPTSFVIDSEGVLKGKITGEAGLDEFEKLFTAVLK